jgi:hypothetical protein
LNILLVLWLLPPLTARQAFPAPRSTDTDIRIGTVPLLSAIAKSNDNARKKVLGTGNKKTDRDLALAAKTNLRRRKNL